MQFTAHTVLCLLAIKDPKVLFVVSNQLSTSYYRRLTAKLAGLEEV